MEKIELKQFVKEKGQQNVAIMLGVSQYAISKAVRSGRKIFILKSADKISAVEEKPFPNR